MATNYDKTATLDIASPDMNQAKFLLNLFDKIAVRVGSDKGSPVYVRGDFEDYGSSYIPLSLGLVGGVNIIQKSYYNNDIDGGKSEDLISQGGNYVFLATAEKILLSSTSPNDSLTGTGANSIKISGLDSAYNEILETVNLNGSNSIQTVNSFLRVNKVEVISAGALQRNAGTITLVSSISLNTVSEIPLDTVGNGVSVDRQGVYTSPRGKTTVITSSHYSLSKRRGVSGTKEVEFRALKISNNIRKELFTLSTRSDSSIYKNSSIYVLNEMEDILFSSISYTGNSRVSGKFDAIEFDNLTFGL